jgi:hypothetical protein
MHTTPILAALFVSGALCTGGTQAAAVHLSNIVPVATAINDFELAPANLIHTWSEQGIRATQIGGDGEIWLANGLGNGNRSWYPDGGDDGWTRITLDSGNNFDAISFFGGSGWSSGLQTLYFELADDNVVVLSGTLGATFNGSWFGFAGGDFDEVRIRASQGWVTGLWDCPSGGPGGPAGCNFAWVDDIRVGAAAVVPEPGVMALVLLALGLMWGAGALGQCRAASSTSSAHAGETA